MDGSGEKPKVSRRDVLKRLGFGAVGLGTAAVGIKLGVDANAPKSSLPEGGPKPVEQKRFDYGFATAKELLGEGYKVTRLDPEGIDSTQAPPMVFDVKSQGRGFDGLDENTEQKGFFYLAGAPIDEFHRGQSVSMQVSLLESQDGSKKYIAFGIDNATGPVEARKFSSDSITYEVAIPLPGSGVKRPASEVGKLVSQKEAEEGGGTLTGTNFDYQNNKPLLQGEKAKKWEDKGAMFFVPLGNTELASFDNVVGGSRDFLPIRLSVRMER